MTKMPHGGILRITRCGSEPGMSVASFYAYLSKPSYMGKGKPTMKKVAVLINDVEQQYEGLRSSLGMLLYETEVQLFVIDKEIANMDEAYHDNMEFLDEMEGGRFSNNSANVEKYGFSYASIEEMGEMLQQADLVIPF